MITGQWGARSMTRREEAERKEREAQAKQILELAKIDRNGGEV